MDATLQAYSHRRVSFRRYCSVLQENLPSAPSAVLFGVACPTPAIETARKIASEASGASAAAERAIQILVFMPFKLGGRVSNKLGVPE
jgi:hypothetical protein